MTSPDPKPETRRRSEDERRDQVRAPHPAHDVPDYERDDFTSVPTGEDYDPFRW